MSKSEKLPRDYFSSGGAKEVGYVVWDDGNKDLEFSS
jgi:hypothetical protein